MSKFRPRRPSAALVISVIALIAALGGTAYAGVTLGKNSVGSRQLKKNAVTTKKIKNNAVTTSKIKNGAVNGSKLNLTGVTVPNATHASTADSATTATNATNASHASTADNASHLGGTAASSYVQFGSTLPAGSTETGVWATAGGNSTSGFEATGFRFNPPLSASLDNAHVIFTTSTATHCSGPGNADPGFLCIYGQSDSGVSFNSIGNGTGTAGASKDGALMFFNVTAASSFAQGFWSVTAPVSSSASAGSAAGRSVPKAPK